MANSITDLINPAYEAMHVVSRELVGFIPAASRNAKLDRAALNQEIKSRYSVKNTADDISPSMTVPEPGDRDYDNVRILKITKSRQVEFGFTGDDTAQINTGTGIISVQANEIAEAMRTIANEIETDLAQEAYRNASRAWGTPGTTPFGEKLTDSAQPRKILDDNGAPLSGRNLVIGTTAGANVRVLPNLVQVEQSADVSMLRQGVLGDVHGFAMRESAQVQNSPGVTGNTKYQTDAKAGVGSTTIPVDTGNQVIKAGAFITLAGDSNKYVVAKDVGASSDSIEIQAPGLLKAVGNNVTVTASPAFEANVAFPSTSLTLALRAPSMPEGGDGAMDTQLIMDDRSGLVFELAKYSGYRKVRYEVAAAWGVRAFNPEHIALLVG